MSLQDMRLGVAREGVMTVTLWTARPPACIGNVHAGHPCALWRTRAPRSQHGQAPGPGRTACVALWVLPTSATWSRDAPGPGGTGRTCGIRHAARRADGRSCPCEVRRMGRNALSTVVAEQGHS